MGERKLLHKEGPKVCDLWADRKDKEKHKYGGAYKFNWQPLQKLSRLVRFGFVFLGDALSSPYKQRPCLLRTFHRAEHIVWLLEGRTNNLVRS